MSKNQSEQIEPTEEQTTEPVEAAETESVEPEAVEAPEGTLETEETDDDKNPNKEAARYRKRLRETEAERDKLAERVEAYQRKEVEAYAKHLKQPSAIWAAGLKLESVLDEDGNVDGEKVKAAVDIAANELGLERSHPLGLQPHPAQMSPGEIPGLGPDDRMAQVIQGRKNYHG